MAAREGGLRRPLPGAAGILSVMGKGREGEGGTPRTSPLLRDRCGLGGETGGMAGWAATQPGGQRLSILYTPPRPATPRPPPWHRSGRPGGEGKNGSIPRGRPSHNHSLPQSLRVCRKEQCGTPLLRCPSRPSPSHDGHGAVLGWHGRRSTASPHRPIEKKMRTLYSRAGEEESRQWRRVSIQKRRRRRQQRTQQPRGESVQQRGQQIRRRCHRRDRRPRSHCRCRRGPRRKEEGR